MKPHPPCKTLFGVSALFIAIWLATGLKNDTSQEAKMRLGGDIEIRQMGQPLPFAAETFLAFNSKTLSRVLILDSIAETPARKISAKLIGVDAAYPLSGSVSYKEILSSEKLHAIIKTYPENERPYEAKVTQTFLDELGIPLGGGFQIGRAKFIAVGIIASLPDGISITTSQHPYLLTSTQAFRATHLFGPASNIHYLYRVSLPEGTSPEALDAKMKMQFPEAQWQMRNWKNIK